MSGPILRAFVLDGQGGGRSVEGAAVLSAMAEGALVWVHLDADHPETRSWLEVALHDVDPFISSALVAEETRPRMVEVNDGMLLVLRGVNLNQDSDPEDMISISMWCDQRRIVTARRSRLRAVVDLVERLEAGKGPRDVGDFVCLLNTRLSERMEPVLSMLDGQTDDIEETVLEEADSALREDIIDVRKQAIMFRRYMAPQRDAIEGLSTADFDWLTAGHKRHLKESYNHITRYIEDLDAIRERAQIVKDELANMLSDRLNKNMYVLSVIAAIFLPLSFLTGLLGVNVAGIPGAGYGLAFWIFTGILVLIVVVQIILFKWLRWF